MANLDRFIEPPGNSTPTEHHNFRVAFRESAFIGLIAAGGTFLPVFVARLGGSNLQVSLISALPSLTGVILAIPLGGLMQSRRNIIPWYSRGRLGSQLGYLAIAAAAFLLPPDLVVPGILAVWSVVTVFSVVTNVSFAVVMDATAGRRGRYELMSRRWSIMGLANAVSLVVVGQALGWLPFPRNYELIFGVLGLLAFAAYRYGSAFRVPDHPPSSHHAGAPRFAPIQDLLVRVRTQPAFLAFVARHFVYQLGLSIAVPLVPLFYVRVIGAPDAWIGVIGTTQALAMLVGYTVWRRASRSRGPRFVLLWSLLGAALPPTALALTREVAVAAAIAGVGAVFTAGINLALFDRMMALAPKGYGVTFSSVDTGVVYAAGIIGPLLAAALADSIGLPTALIVATIPGLIGTLLFAIDRSTASEQQPKERPGASIAPPGPEEGEPAPT